MQNLNLFKSIPPSTVECQLRNEIIATRLFLFLLLFSLIILLLYTTLITVTKTMNVDAPSFEEYLTLYATQFQTLTCACSKISIGYGEILHVNYTFHQVCSSAFVTDDWINYVFNSREEDQFLTLAFIETCIDAFQALKGLCELINQTLSDSLTQFYFVQYVSASVTSSDLLQSQTEALIDQLRSTTINHFRSSLSTVRNITQSNAILSSRLTNYALYYNNFTSSISFTTRIYSHLSCHCAISPTCVEETSFYNPSNGLVVFLVPGFYGGCYAIESLLQSTLQCFYNQTCVDAIQFYLSSSLPLNVKTLNSSVSSNYLINSTVNELLDKLMIEEWNLSTMYEGYYNQCRPAQCTYTYETRNDAIHIVTTLIGLIGGMVTVLKLFVPPAVKLIAYCVRKWKMRVAPHPASFET